MRTSRLPVPAKPASIPYRVACNYNEKFVPAAEKKEGKEKERQKERTRGRKEEERKKVLKEEAGGGAQIIVFIDSRMP